MSIKNKKHITRSKNSYRTKRIEDYLVSQGYILKDPDKDLRIWVDCVGNGRDISYTLLDLHNVDARGRGHPRAQYSLNIFDVHCRAHRAPRTLYSSHQTLLGAIESSRDTPYSAY